jgi:hypothetical protein
MQQARNTSLGNYFHFVRDLEFGDCVAFLYLLVFVRQYLWVVNNNVVAWTITIVLTTICWYVYIRTKPFPSERFGLSFWLIVGLPLLIAYLLRAAFPDHSYDVLTYHILHSQRTLEGPLFSANDFFPSPIAVNPVADTLTGVSRVLLGFRLGTIINFVALIWAAQVIDKLLRLFLDRSWLRAAAVLGVLSAEHLFFEISTYLIDLLALPLMLEATLLTVKASQAKNRDFNFVRIALLLGASTGFKLTNLAVAIPVLAIAASETFRMPLRSVKHVSWVIALAGVMFAAPLLPFTIYIFRLTGNPVFPIANVYFKSPYWPTHGGWDNRFGPQTIWETIVWPMLIWFLPERHSELGIYSGRLPVGFILASVGLLLYWKNKPARIICLILFTSSLLWSATAQGYSRYGLYQEILAGIVICMLAALLLRATSRRFNWSTILASVILVIFVAQFFLAWAYSLRTDWSSRSTFVKDPDKYFEEAAWMLRDRSLTDFVTPDQRAVFSSLPAWLETCSKSTAFEVLLSPSSGILAARQPEYFYTRNARLRFIDAFRAVPGDKLFSLCLSSDIEVAKQAIASRGLTVSKVTPTEIPFFSQNNRVGMILIEVQKPTDAEAIRTFESSALNAAFPDSDYSETITALDAPETMRPSEKRVIRFRVKNQGYSTWPSTGNDEGRYRVNIGDRWLDEAGKVELNGLDGRTPLPQDLVPGAEVEMPLTVVAPSTRGNYVLEIDMVHEGVTWFWERGAKPLRLRVKVTD